MAPPWLFSAESDARVPPVSAAAALDGVAHGRSRQGPWASPSATPRRTQVVFPGRPAAAFWAQNPPPAALVHFVCAAWPGSGGRVMAMELWGKWFHRDIDAQLGTISRSAAGSPPLIKAP